MKDGQPGRAGQVDDPPIRQELPQIPPHRACRGGIGGPELKQNDADHKRRVSIRKKLIPVRSEFPADRDPSRSADKPVMIRSLDLHDIRAVMALAIVNREPGGARRSCRS